MSCPSPSALSSFPDGNIFVQPKAVIRKKRAGACKLCGVNFLSKQNLHDHIVSHVSLPTIILRRICWPIVLKINKDRLNQADHEFEDLELGYASEDPKKTSLKQPVIKPDVDDERSSDNPDKPCPLKLTIKKFSSAGTPAFTVVPTPSPPSTDIPHLTEENFERIASSYMTETCDEVSENGIMSEEEDQMVDDNFSSNEVNLETNRTMESDPAMDQQNMEVNGSENEPNLEMSAKDDPEDVDKKLILKLTSKKEFIDIDEQGELEAEQSETEQSDSKDESFCDDDEISFKNGIVKQSIEDMKSDGNLFDKDEEDSKVYNHKDGIASESEDDIGKEASSPAPSANSVNSAENSGAVSPAPDSDSGVTSDSKDMDSKPSRTPKTEGGGLRVRSSLEMLKTSISDFDTKNSDDPLSGENSDSFLGMSDGGQLQAPVPSSPGLTVLSAAQLGATDNSSCDSDNLLHNLDYQNQVAPGFSNYGMPGDSVEYMSIDQLGAGEMCNYKCNLGPECSNMLFMNAADLSAHQASIHPLVPPVQQLAQQFSGQVQRLQVPPPQPGMPPQGPQYAMRGMPGPQFRQGMPPHSGLLAPKQGMGSPRYPNAQSRFSSPQSLRPRLQMSPVNGRGQPIVGRGGGVKRPGPPLGRGGTPGPQKRRYDTLMPSRLEDNDCHVIAMQKRNNDAGLVIQNVQGRDNNLFQLSDAITLSLRNQQPKENPSKSVTNVLASRGITVTPSGGGGKSAPVSPRRNSPTEAALNSLNLNSAISIISTNTGNNANKQPSNSGFAVPKGVVRTSVSERPPRPPTVDLTGNDPPQRLGRTQFTCQVCDKTFSTPDSLNQHMLSHRTGTKSLLPYKCNLCNAQYPNQPALIQHKKSHHKDPASGPEMALPVVDLKQPGTLNRLQQLGVKFCIPLAQLGNQSGGFFGLPVISIDGAKNPAVSNLSALGASNILSLGPIKSLGR